MKKKYSALCLIFIAVICVGLPMLCACDQNKEENPIEVELELVNPNTGEIMQEGEQIDLPAEQTYVEICIKDKKTGTYLTDKDLPENNVKDSYHINFLSLNKKGCTDYPIYTCGYWPKKSELNPFYNHYEIAIFFDCKPKYLEDPKFQRKYKTSTAYIRFFINK